MLKSCNNQAEYDRSHGFTLLEDYDYLDYLPPLKVYACHCEQCKLEKKSTRTSVRKTIRRFLNKQRRSNKLAGKCIVYYWA